MSVSLPKSAPADNQALDVARDAAPRAEPDPAPGSGARDSLTETIPKVAGAVPASKQAPRSKPLMLDLESVADVEGLAEEVAVLRASIRALVHPNDDLSEHVKILAELRHQIEALCSALKTQQALRGRDGDERAADLTRVLEDLGDRLGVSS